MKDAKGASRIGAPANVLKMYKDVPRAFGAWDIDSVYENEPVALDGDSRVSIAENTPFKCTVCVERSFSGSAWVQDIPWKPMLPVWTSTPMWTGTRCIAC